MMIPNQKNQPAACLLAGLMACTVLLAAQPASAGTDTWNGGATPNGNWQTPGNWNGVAPATNDLLIFAGGTQTSATNNYPAGTPFENIAFGSGASSFILNGNGMTLSAPTDAGSGLIANGSLNNSSANTETIALPIVLASGNHTISSIVGGFLNLNGSITHSNGAVVSMTGNINATGGLSTNGSANGILGGWAIYANNWATLDAHSNIVAYTGYVNVAPGGVIANISAANVAIPTAGAAISTTAGTTAINSLLFSAGTANQTVAVGAGNKLVLGQNGGIYNSSSIASGGTYRVLTVGSSLAAGGILTAGDGIHPAQITLGSPPLSSGSSGFITINSSIQDNNGAPVTVTLAGAYASFNGGGNASQTNTYSGGTYILQGRVSQPGLYTFGSGPVYILPGGQANCGCQTPNDFYIMGSGTTENNGMGALRLYSASLANGYTGNLPGTIHLLGHANICADNITVAGQLIGISGKITGSGSLGIGSPTATSRSGVINIGATNGATDIPNDYAGDTSINGINGGTISSTLRICYPTDNNIMPNGTNGSYAGGLTGNLILNGNLSSRQAIFDLNGSTQTINGLISTAASPANDLIQDNGAGNGTLIVGNSDATSTFGGAIQNSINLIKIGKGILTLSGGNSYNGNTTINGGTLVTTTVSSGNGNYTVSNNAALGVVTATSGGTLQVNNLTFGASGSALQLSAGTNGDPAAAIVNVGGALAMNGNVKISLSGVGLTAGGPFTVMTYNPANRTGSGVFSLNNSPRVVATLNDDTVNGIVSITIISADTAVKWKGGALGNWDISDSANTIWQTVPSGNSAYYIEAGSGNDTVLFDDTLTGTPNVTLTTTLTPQGITVSNSAANYLFTGTGAIAGATGLTKAGTGTLTIANAGNNTFSGNIAINAGTLIISNTSAIGNSITGSGALAKSGSGTLTLSGDSSGFNGPVAVNGGTLSVLNSISLATASSTAIANGATLDIGNNNVALAFEPITVSGSGVGGNGAIVNSSGYSGNALSTSFQQLTLTGNTTIGGPGRLDFRSSDPNNGSDATLSTGGNAYKLTKVSGNTLQLAGVQIDPALGNIDVQGGVLSLQGVMPSLGNIASTLTVFNGAILQFAGLNVSPNNDVNKVLVMQNGAIINNSTGSSQFDGPVTLQGTGLFNIAGTSLTFTNVLSGAGNLNKVTGAGALYLESSNTYSGNTLIGAGNLYLTGAGDIRNSQSITMGAGTTLDVSGRSDGMLTLLGGNSLTGNGTLNGSLTNLPGSTLAVGTPSTIGTFTINGGAWLNGTTIVKVVETNLTADVINVGNGLTFGGILQVNNLTGTYVSGDQIQLFTGGLSGSFANIIPATPGYNLTWDTNALATSGILSVIGTGPNQSPTNIISSFDGANLTLSWPMDHTGWLLQVQTNSLATGLGANWTTILGSSATNQVVIPVNATSGAVFYRMMYP